MHDGVVHRILAEWLDNFSINTLQINGLVVEVLFVWPARSPNFNPLDFHLRGHLKSIVHATSIEHAEILRNRTEHGFRQIRETPGMTVRVTKSSTGLFSNARRSFLCIFCESN